MAIDSRDALLTLGTGLLLLVGAGLIVFGEFLPTVVGIVLVTLSAVIFIVDAKEILVDTDDYAQQ